LNSKGKYLLSLGSDDGLIRSALTVIYDTLCRFQDDDILVFNGTKYFWPDSPSRNLSNRIFAERIPREGINAVKLVDSTSQYILQIARSEISYSKLPMLYLYSCIRRSFIDKIIAYSGKFEDGDSQDVYTGFIALFIKNRILHLNYPLLIGGSSEIGVGTNSESSFTTMQKMASKYRDKYRYFRYSNLYSAEYRKLCGGFTNGPELLVYREYIKASRYESSSNIVASDLEIVLKKIIKRLPLNSCDIDTYEVPLERMARIAGKDVYLNCALFCKREKRKKRLKIIIKRIIRPSKKNSLYRVYQRLRWRLNPNGYAITVDLDKYGEAGLVCAEEHIFSIINK